ncbi:MAG TPA: hypothetical protein VFS32_11810 [Candidatus Limnocylindrales bacterium]|nr:hypothetical protein [Candidatus Limnocylindrales bacterium]
MAEGHHPVRRAGQATLPDGAIVTWTVAEGAKGRRWREVVVRGGAIVHSLLLETFPDRRFAHLELATPAGLLTLHPEGDGTLHGNAVTGEGVRHVRGLPWSDRAVVLVVGSSVAAAAAAHCLAAADPGAEVDRVRIGPDLDLDRRPERVAALSVAIDRDGLPRLPGGRTWPLEDELPDPSRPV